MRVVLDTNILVSACLKPGGLEWNAVHLALDGRCSACVSEATWAEYRDVLLRDKFAAYRVQAEFFLHALDARVECVRTAVAADAATDPDDNRFLECAAAAHADYLVTGNLKHYPAAQWGATKIVNARGFFAEGFPDLV
jgi:putative PIN family toxin of toxin-antitoxin system